ncbi:TPA: phage head closure protein [Clostridioides difficile]|uniref:phage head closure protein n=1 Tax=Clostridioides difficile TaxID=1496 RepID=UPI00097FF3B1|nr:phage head closure protein [Clostridioides difficile]MBY1307227.1 phage head closure protein [Clostridioides difficile]MDB3375133.1 head-tail adaptor protein [Clostridioides difficile]MDY6677916.1 phage head closure protein [Clostridioides difficile]SJV21224.1 putative phage head-tail adaptor [Clostridioides difficile]HBF7200952.1 phage head closure protein [Clostridioides difficile]
MLDYRIIIEKLSDNDTDERGFSLDDWREYYTCWSNFKNVSGKEYISAKATSSENIVTFTIRYSEKVKLIIEDAESTKIYRIRYRNKIYDIIYISDFENKHRFVDFKCKLIS